MEQRARARVSVPRAVIVVDHVVLVMHGLQQRVRVLLQPVLPLPCVYYYFLLRRYRRHHCKVLVCIRVCKSPSINEFYFIFFTVKERENAKTMFFYRPFRVFRAEVRNRWPKMINNPATIAKTMWPT
jgi:hypothetical protein